MFSYPTRFSCITVQARSLADFCSLTSALLEIQQLRSANAEFPAFAGRWAYFLYKRNALTFWGSVSSVRGKGTFGCSRRLDLFESRCCRFIFVFRAPLKLVDDVLYLDKNSGARYGEIDFILRELD